MSIQLMPASSARSIAAVLVAGVLVDQDAADPAAAEHQLRDLPAGPAERSVAHGSSPQVIGTMTCS